MSSTILIPPEYVLRDLDPRLAEWIRQINAALTGGIEGKDVLTSTASTAKGVVDGSVAITANIEGVGDLANALSAQAANTDAVAESQSGGGTLSLSLSRSILVATAPSEGESATTPTVTVTITGETGTPTIEWAASNGVAVSDADAETVSFSGFPPQGARIVSIGTVTVTDDNGSTVRNVPITLNGAPANEGVLL